MHEFYLKNKARYKKSADKMLRFAAPELEKITNRSYSEVFDEIWKHYESNMLENFPYIGGDEVSGTGNLTGAYTYVSMGEVLKRYGVSIEDSAHIMVLSYERMTEKIPRIVRKIMVKLFIKPKLLNRVFLKKDAKNAANAAKNPGSFVTQTQIPPEEGYQFSYHNLYCPLSEFAHKYGYEEYMPYLCNLDYVMFGVLGAPLYREHTVFSDGDYCDFKLNTQAKPMPYWPPVFLQGRGFK